MTLTNLITADEVRSLAIYATSYDTTFVSPHILTTQEHYIRPFLGKDFYQELMDEALTSFSADNTAMLVHLKKALAYFVLYEAMPELVVKIEDAGFMIDRSETSAAANETNLDMRRKDLMRKAQMYLSLTRQYIVDSQDTELGGVTTKFPNWNVSIADDAASENISIHIE